MSKDPDTMIHPSAEVSGGASIGAGTLVWHQAQVREGAVIGDGCVLGKGVYIDIKVKIGNKVKIQNYACLYQGLTVGDEVFIGPHVCFTNDLRPRAHNEEWQIVPTRVESGASVGAGSIIICGVTLGANCMVAAGSVVTKDVPAQTLVAGNPARQAGTVCRCGEKIETGVTECPACGGTF